MTETEPNSLKATSKEYWPDVIPWTYPVEDGFITPWLEKSHPKLEEVDNYPMTNPTATSLGYDYLGDVCPYCGTPLGIHEDVINTHGERGELSNVSPDSNPVPCYHPKCWRKRQAEKDGGKASELEQWTD